MLTAPRKYHSGLKLGIDSTERALVAIVTTWHGGVS